MPSLFAASKAAVDPTIAALFTSSLGPIAVPSKSRYMELLPQTRRQVSIEQEDDEELSSAEGSGDGEAESFSGSNDEDDEPEDDDSSAEAGSQASPVASSDSEDGQDLDGQVPHLIEAAMVRAQKSDRKERKRKRDREDNVDLESNYLERLEYDAERATKRAKADKKADEAVANDDGVDTSSDPEASARGEEGERVDGEAEPVLVHESMSKTAEEDELEKANRTVFLSNVSTEAITNRKFHKALLRHLSQHLDKDATPPQTIQSFRFRSVAFGGGSMPKRAAFINRELMGATTKAANAYVVYSTAAAARTAVSKLNGTVVLDRHLRADSVAHPTPVDHRRCIFVGNLGFVDDETVLNTNRETGETTERKRTKVPSDIEEGLWRTFGQHAGKVESVRVPRDEKTRVGKGFAYVQFDDANGVEAALLLNDKAFPPMLPRKLRVSRAKAPHKTVRAMERSREAKPIGGARPTNGKGKKSTKYAPKRTAEQQTLAGRAKKLLGSQRGGVPKERGNASAAQKRLRDSSGAKDAVPKMKTPEEIIFEGRRASSRDGKPRDLKMKGKKAKGGHAPKGKPKRR